MAKPILLHTCCAPCAAGAVERVISEGWTPTLYYANSNIAPESEFYKRLAEAERLAQHHRIALIVEPYNHKDWLGITGKLSNEPEGGSRCALCFGYNLELTARKTLELGFFDFSTTLSISPYKNFDTLSEQGALVSAGLQQESHRETNQQLPTFQAINFKKQAGYQRSVELSRLMGFYRQEYCGCEFSLKESLQRRTQST